MSGLETDADVVVVGLGAWGSAAAHHLARRGHRVVGIDRHAPPHAHGSSHGGSRVLFAANLLTPPYRALIRRSQELWRRLETDSGRELVVATGGVHVGPAGSELVEATAAAYRTDGIPHEMLDPRAVARAIPVLRTQPGEVAILERSTWVLRPEHAIAAHLEMAAGDGASLVLSEEVLGWETGTHGVTVMTERRSIRARHAVLALGAWSGDRAGGSLPVIAERQVSAWFIPSPGAEGFGAGSLPVFVLGDTFENRCYGVPAMDGEGVKVAYHHGGTTGHPDRLERTVEARDLEPLQGVVRERFPDLDPAPSRAETCRYPNSPDRHPLVGVLAGHPDVVVASGGSGHGFRLSPVIGEAVADLVEERPRTDLAAFAPGRGDAPH